MTIIDLPDGRRLDIDVAGPVDGTPLVIHHGMPGSVTPMRGVERAAHERGLRTVRYSRAGYGSSTRRPGRTVADVADDIAAILDHLGATGCVTAGWSCGGPHALATAARLGDRVFGALVVAGVAPYDQPGLDFLAGMGEQNLIEFGAALRGEDALRPQLESDAAQVGTGDVEGLIAGMATILPEVDRVALTAEFGADLAANFVEAVRTGVDGWLDDDLAILRPWGFDLADIAVPVFLWQGDADLMVPFAHGRWLGEHIPGVTTHFVPGHGHLSISEAEIDRMLDELVARIPAGERKTDPRCPLPDGNELSYDVTGDGALAVYAHGLLGSREIENDMGLYSWDPVTRLDGWRLVRYDVRGHGKSTGSPNPADYTIAHHAEDLAVLLDHLGDGRAAAGMGASFGCGTVLTAAIRDPARFDRLVLLIPPVAWEDRPAHNEAYRETADFVAAEGVDALLAAQAAAPVPSSLVGAPGFPRREYGVGAALIVDVLRGAAMSDLPPRAEIATLRQPALILARAGDPGHPVAVAERMAELLPNSRLIVSTNPAGIAAWGDHIAEFLAQPLDR